MEGTFQEFIAEIASLFGKDFDHAFKKGLEFAVIGFRATLLRQEYDKHGRFPSTSQHSICLELTSSTPGECCLGDQVQCNVQRTVNKVPSPIRTARNPEPFVFVGSSEQEIAFTFTNPEYMKLILEGSKFRSKSFMYAHYNDYIYTFNYEGGKVAVRAAFANPLQLLEATSCGSVPCIERFDIEQDLRKVIKQMVLEDYRALGIIPETKEVKINES